MNARLSDTHPVQSTITDLSVGTFVLESMVYYIGGLIDEELYLLNDVENAIIQRYANKVLRQAITTVSDVAGPPHNSTPSSVKIPNRTNFQVLWQPKLTSPTRR